MINWHQILEKSIAIRQFETVVQELYSTDCIQSPVHLSIGQELASALIADNYSKEDHLVGNYRSHGISVGITDDYEPLILELLAKKGGVSSGKAGSMHLSVPNKNLMWTSAIVGTGVPIALGIADSLKRKESSGIVTVMFGDGAIEEGCVLESINIASLFKLPIVLLLEDNNLAIHTSKAKRSAVKSYTELANSFGLKTFNSTYKNPLHLSQTFSDAYKYTRNLRLPCFLRVECYRWIEHVGVSDDWHMGYRSESEINEWKDKDIILNPHLIGLTQSFSEDKLNYYYELFSNMFAKLASYPDPVLEDLYTNVY